MEAKYGFSIIDSRIFYLYTPTNDGKQFVVPIGNCIH